ncbi:hypothetical protein [Roseibacillus persicicus]|uniref:Uncharacterized protein n=1 Tax=Roseibacillus persicicus TaxID=454148 RepID=A0A918TSF7_9BACT|nr:hypothetical protein [Roseibacillus persicicus]GHC61089.1 hypothetical protein GCM10007100_30450 [Roseibacillus persicicus]
MRPKTKPPVCDQWRWLHELEAPHPSFWEVMNYLGQSEFELHSAAVSYRGNIDLGASYLDEGGYFLSTQPSLTFQQAQIDKVYVVETDDSGSGAIEFDFSNRGSRLSFVNVGPDSLALLTNLFGWEMKPENESLQAHRKVKPLTLCPCCQDASVTRRKLAGQNPFFNILTALCKTGEHTTLTIPASGTQLVASHHPRRVETREGRIISEGENDVFLIDAGAIHGIFISRENFDGQAVRKVSCINTHGGVIASLSAPAHAFTNRWQTLLGTPDGRYQEHTP